MHKSQRVLCQIGRTCLRSQQQKQQFNLHIQQKQQHHTLLLTLACCPSTVVTGLTTATAPASSPAETVNSQYNNSHRSQSRRCTLLPTTIPAQFYSKFTAARESLPLGSLPLCEERALDLISNLKETELAAIKLALKKYEATKQKENFEGKSTHRFI